MAQRSAWSLDGQEGNTSASQVWAFSVDEVHNPVLHRAIGACTGSYSRRFMLAIMTFRQSRLFSRVIGSVKGLDRADQRFGEPFEAAAGVASGVFRSSRLCPIFCPRKNPNGNSPCRFPPEFQREIQGRVPTSAERG